MEQKDNHIIVILCSLRVGIFSVLFKHNFFYFCGFLCSLSNSLYSILIQIILFLLLNLFFSHLIVKSAIINVWIQHVKQKMFSDIWKLIVSMNLFTKYHYKWLFCLSLFIYRKILLQFYILFYIFLLFPNSWIFLLTVIFILGFSL